MNSLDQNNPMSLDDEKNESPDEAEDSVKLCSRGTWPMYLTGFLNFLSIAFSLVAIPTLVNKIVAGSDEPNSRSVFYYGVFYGLEQLSQFLFVKYLGAISDIAGRKPMLIVNNIGQAISFGILAVTTTFWPIALAAIAEGGTSSFFAVGQSYISDLLPGKRRSESYALFIGLSVGGAFSIGVVSGAILAESDLRAPFYISLFISIICMICVYCLVYPDTLPGQANHNRANPSSLISPLNDSSVTCSIWTWEAWTKIRTSGNPFSILSFAFKSSAKLDSSLTSLWVIFFFLEAGLIVVQAMFINWTYEALGWSSSEAGVAIAFVGLSIAIMPKLVISRIGEEKSIKFGTFLFGLSYLCYAFINEEYSYLVYPTLLLSAVGGSCLPAIFSVLSRRHSALDQGSVQGAASCIQVLAGTITSLVANALMSYFISNNSSIYFPGAGFIYGALVFWIASVIAFYTL